MKALLLGGSTTLWIENGNFILNDSLGNIFAFLVSRVFLQGGNFHYSQVQHSTMISLNLLAN